MNQHARHGNAVRRRNVAKWGLSFALQYESRVRRRKRLQNVVVMRFEIRPISKRQSHRVEHAGRHPATGVTVDAGVVHEEVAGDVFRSPVARLERRRGGGGGGGGDGGRRRFRRICRRCRGRVVVARVVTDGARACGRPLERPAAAATAAASRATRQRYHSYSGEHWCARHARSDVSNECSQSNKSHDKKITLLFYTFCHSMVGRTRI